MHIDCLIGCLQCWFDKGHLNLFISSYSLVIHVSFVHAIMIWIRLSLFVELFSHLPLLLPTCGRRLFTRNDDVVHISSYNGEANLSDFATVPVFCCISRDLF